VCGNFLREVERKKQWREWDCAADAAEGGRSQSDRREDMFMSGNRVIIIMRYLLSTPTRRMSISGLVEKTCHSSYKYRQGI
jgi:hypothetical protein